MPELINARVEACYQLAEAFFKRPFSRPEVSLKLRGKNAGVAHLQENKLRFNPALYRDNLDDFLRQTVAHEVAHLVAHQLFGRGIQPHGQEWQLIMRGVYQLAPLRCHNYAVQQRQLKRFIYRCDCPGAEFPFSSQRHHWVAKGRSYRCRRCKGELLFSGEQRTT